MADYPHDTWGLERKDRFGHWRLISVPLNTSQARIQETLAALSPDYRAVPITITRRFLNTDETGTEAKEAA